jgi:serine/threonine protein kinase, bacterial
VVESETASNTPRVLPFARDSSLTTDLSLPGALAVDAAGNAYVTDNYLFLRRVLELPAGSRGQHVVPFAGIDRRGGLAVDSADNLYVADSGHNCVVKLAPG